MYLRDVSDDELIFDVFKGFYNTETVNKFYLVSPVVAAVSSMVFLDSIDMISNSIDFALSDR